MRALQITDGSRYVPWIDEPQTGSPADLISTKKLPRSRIRVLRHLVVLMEGGDVPRDIGVNASEELGHQEFVLTYKTFEPSGPACLPLA